MLRVFVVCKYKVLLLLLRVPVLMICLWSESGHQRFVRDMELWP